MDREPLEAAEGNLREAKSDPDLMDINPPGAIGSGGQFPPDRPPGRVERIGCQVEEKAP